MVAGSVPFLADLRPRPWKPAGAIKLRQPRLYVGNGTNAVEVVVGIASSKPKRSDLEACWKGRHGGRASPVVLVVIYYDKTITYPPPGASSHAFEHLDLGQAERLCREVLLQPDRHAALYVLSQAAQTIESDLPGIANEGLVALHELRHGVPQRKDWNQAADKAKRCTGKRSESLLQSLGFKLKSLDNHTKLLLGGETRTALAVMLLDTETPEGESLRFNSLSPVSYALKKADEEKLPWLMLVQGSRLRLYACDVGAGVGRRGRTESWLECQTSLLGDKQLSYLWLLFSAEALAKGGSLEKVLEDSHNFAGSLAERLRERIYKDVVPALAKGVVATRNIENPSREELSHCYQMALTILFRLLFVAYAEDRDLLPYRSKQAYRKRSLKQKARELADCIAAEEPIAPGTNHWQEAMTLWSAVAKGNPQWSVPAYDGGLFSDDRAISPAGADLASIVIQNEHFEAALRGLLVIDTAEGVPGSVDFRTLGVREFGTIYEGLLESELALADTDLALDIKGSYVPVRTARRNNQVEGSRVTEQAGKLGARKRDSRFSKVVVSKGNVYLHDRSGARKVSGSYYTKPFAVDYLLDEALEPALADHLRKLNCMDDTDASKAFFDFRVADIAMGSGHFLIAAIDRMEKGMAGYLADRNLAGVRSVLAKLRNTAQKAAGDITDAWAFEDSVILRRQIAKQCIYGVDINPLAVQLARLAVWIHTFVPGLPLSVLDHKLICGNSLVGVGTLDAVLKNAAAKNSLYVSQVKGIVEKASAPMARLANCYDATLAGVAATRSTFAEAQMQVRPARMLFDLISAAPISADPQVCNFTIEGWQGKFDERFLSDAEKAHDELAGLRPLHFPVAFPDVFMRARPGFDVIIGNPPWSKPKVEEHDFWARFFPGLRSLPQHEIDSKIKRLRAERKDIVRIYEEEVSDAALARRFLLSPNYSGMGTGDPDLYKAFCWRFWHLAASDGGRIGVVLPRSALAASGSTPFRHKIFGNAADIGVAILDNNRHWVFPDVHPQFTFSLVSIARGKPANDTISISGPYRSHDEFAQVRNQNAVHLDRRQVTEWNESAALPLFPTSQSLAIFAQMKLSPRLGLSNSSTWRARPDRELDSNLHKKLIDLKNEKKLVGYWKVYKGESFNLWTPDTGSYYTWTDPEPVLDWLQISRLRTPKGSVHREFGLQHLRDRATLPCNAPRLAFRRMSRRTDQRTTIACLVPPRVFIVDSAPYFLWPRGDAKDVIFLLGILSSIPLDWQARRVIETNVSFGKINDFPIPRPGRESKAWQRIVSLAGRLACTDTRFSCFAKKISVTCGKIDDDEKQDMIQELDALAAHLYGLDEKQLIHIFETFHVNWDYSERLEGVLGHFRKLPST